MYYSIRSNIRIINIDSMMIENCFKVLDNSRGKQFDINNSSYVLIKFINDSSVDSNLIPGLIAEKFSLSISDSESFINYLVNQGLLFTSETKEYNKNILNPYTIYNPLRRISIEVTEKCNLGCFHCYGAFGEHSPKKSLSYKEIEDISADLDVLNSYQLALTGGEFFLHPEFKAIFALFKNKGYEMTVFSNGYFTDNAIELMEDNKDCLTSFRISIDGFSDTHNKIRKNNLSFQNAIRTVVALKKFKNIDVGASMTISKLNYLEVNDFTKYMEDEYGINTSYDLAFQNMNNATHKDFLFSIDEFDILKKTVPSIFTFDKFKVKKTKEDFRCIGGIYAAAITADKKMKICTGAMEDIFYFGSIPKNGIIELWENPNQNISFYRKEKLKDIQKCNECNSCCPFTNCRLLATTWTGNQHNPNPMFCFGNKVLI